MSFSPTWSWDNRGKTVRIDPKTGRSWTRRIRCLEDGERIKLKLEDREVYKEVLVDKISSETIYKRFKEGQSIDDCLSILANPVPTSLQSRRAQG